MGGKKGGNNKKNKSQNPNGNIPDWSLKSYELITGKILALKK